MLEAVTTMSSEGAVDSMAKAKEVILAMHGIKEMTCSDQPPSGGPSFVEVNSQVRQRLGLRSTTFCDLASPAMIRLLRVRSRSENGNDFFRSRPRTLSEVWNYDKYDSPLRKKLRPLDVTRMRESSWTSFWSIIRQAISAVVLFLLTIAAALAIHWWVGPSDIATDDIRPPITTGDVCGPEMSTVDIEALGITLRREVFGQDLAVDTLIQPLSDHFSWNRSGEQHSKCEPIVLVLHGGTGTGKTHTARIMSKYFSRVGMKVQWYFPIFNRRESKHFLLDWVIASSSSSSSGHVFILDDVDVNNELAFQLEAVVSFWKSMTFPVNAIGPIFVITSSKEAEFLETSLLNHVAKGDCREDFSRYVVQWQCPFGRELQATYVPFLPIQSEQLTECVRHALHEGVAGDNATWLLMEEAIQAVIGRTNFVPAECPLFSKYGCKRLQLV